MAIIGLTLSAEVTHESIHDDKRGTEEASVFRLGTLDSRVMGRLRDDATSFAVNPSAPEDEVDVSVGQNQLYYLACQFGLRGWQRFRDEAGNDIRFVTQKRNMGGRSYTIVADECLARMPQPVIVELGTRLIEMNDVKVEEAKN